MNNAFKPDRRAPLSNIHLTLNTLFSVDTQRRPKLKIFFNHLYSGIWKYLDSLVFTLSWEEKDPERSVLPQKTGFGPSSPVTNQLSPLIFKITFEEDAKQMLTGSAFNDNIIICEVVPYFHLFVLCWLPSGSVGGACDLRITIIVKYRMDIFRSLKWELELKFLSNSQE